MLIAATACTAFAADNDFGGIATYEAANKELAAKGPSEGRIVLLGNSITYYWAQMRPDFFEQNNLVGRGISGQTSYQFLVRFRDDVINLKPFAVVINAATNDVAENTGPYNEDRTFGNIVSMVELAEANGIVPVLSTVLPAACFPWRMSIAEAPAKITSLNKRLREYAAEKGLLFIDYYSPMVVDGGALNPGYSNDGVHPTEPGYEVMEGVLLPQLKSLRQSKGL